MKFIPAVSMDYITIELTPDYIVCTWLAPSGHKAKLKAYTKHTFDHGASKSGALCNPSHLIKHIQNFVQRYALHDAVCVLSVAGPAMYEHILSLPVATPSAQHIMQPGMEQLTWESHYLYPTEEHMFDFYVSGMRREHRLQYQLLALNAHLNLVTLTSPFMAAMHVYEQLHGTNFRRADLAQKMQQSKKNIFETFTPDTLTNLVSIHPAASINIRDELKHIIVAYGLLLSGEHTDETH